MDDSTLKYMGEKVDRARVINGQITKLEMLQKSLTEATGFGIYFNTKDANGRAMRDQKANNYMSVPDHETKMFLFDTIALQVSKLVLEKDGL